MEVSRHTLGTFVVWQQRYSWQKKSTFSTFWEGLAWWAILVRSTARADTELVVVWTLDKTEVIHLENLTSIKSIRKWATYVHIVEYLLTVTGVLLYVKYLDGFKDLEARKLRCKVFREVLSNKFPLMLFFFPFSEVLPFPCSNLENAQFLWFLVLLNLCEKNVQPWTLNEAQCAEWWFSAVLFQMLSLVFLKTSPHIRLPTWGPEEWTLKIKKKKNQTTSIYLWNDYYSPTTNSLKLVHKLRVWRVSFWHFDFLIWKWGY